MSNLAAAALARPRFTFLAVLAVVLAGLWLVLDFPSTEEPPVTIRTATVLSYVPGANTERMEQLVGRPTIRRSVPASCPMCGNGCATV